MYLSRYSYYYLPTFSFDFTLSAVILFITDAKKKNANTQITITKNNFYSSINGYYDIRTEISTFQTEHVPFRWILQRRFDY
jgi:hypothetical protein